MSLWQRKELIFLLLAVILISATFLEPTLPLTKPTYRYLFVFDISQSMNVEDVSAAGQSRLQYAKQQSWAALSSLPCGSELGFALFSGHRAFLLITPVELCAHYRELSAILQRIDWSMTWEARSEIAKGVFKSLKLSEAQNEQTRLVFFTDGHEAPPINPEVPPRFNGEPGKIGGIIVGVGGDELVTIPKFSNDGQEQGVWAAEDVMHIDTFTAEQQARDGGQAPVIGTEHLSSLRENYLQSLAEKTGLNYHRLAKAGDFSDALQAPELAIPVVSPSDIRPLYALGALLIFVATLLFSSRGVLKRAR